ncbi:hypothetical protein M0813_17015 [Anaeramoeba flamelloides]|uniref:Uncharacterized protein n=1 Tax=Anaeramoeba flamelloides TaxID=1746091 RepID=A0ABQ8YYG2_9EUKA|nr:hypothetical protein M0813_17015 [Anaeramoeba flamelloides]
MSLAICDTQGILIYFKTGIKGHNNDQGAFNKSDLTEILIKRLILDFLQNKIITNNYIITILNSIKVDELIDGNKNEDELLINLEVKNTKINTKKKKSNKMKKHYSICTDELNSNQEIILIEENLEYRLYILNEDSNNFIHDHKQTLDQSSDDDEHDKNQNFHDDQNTKSLNHNQKENYININKNHPYGYERLKSDESDNENKNKNKNENENNYENTNNFDCLQQTQNEKKRILPNNIEFNREVLYLLENLTGISRRSLERGLSSFIERNFGLHNIHPHNKQKIIFGKASLKKNKKKEKINLRKRKKKFKITYKKQTKENQKSNSLKDPIKEKSIRIEKGNQTNTLNTNIAQKNKKKKTNPNQKRSPPKNSKQETTVQKNDNYFTLPLKLSFSPPHINKVSENNWLFEIEKKYSYEFD